MEAEVVRMVINLYNGHENCCGSLTSGGTESIILAVKAYRDYGRKIRGIIKPELVLPDTAHAAFHKACQYFNVKLRLIPVDSRTFEANIRAMERAINRNTIALVGSACAFPHGIIDDIQSLAKVLYCIAIYHRHLVLMKQKDWIKTFHTSACRLLSWWFYCSIRKRCWFSNRTCRFFS